MLQFLKLDLMHGAFDSTDVMPIREACHVVVQSKRVGSGFCSTDNRGWVSCYARLRGILSSLFCTLPRGLRRTRNRSKVDSRSENEAPETLLGLQMNRSASEFDLAPQKLDLASSTS
ncbi:autophagy-related protein 3 [Iris pallida]|uniref:Autophagy-related protein 3 n=1 Tax=Iris pallida TaxID=29817 RepID=A0AAX6ES12_IRIPA|nr:autophagy-related protein 3 [Iris pallida]